MAVKISQLPSNNLPYQGSEQIPLVQSGVTRAGTLSSLTTYLSGSLLSVNRYAQLSGQFATKIGNNNFRTSQTIFGSLTASSLILSGGYVLQSTSDSLKLRPDTIAISGTNNIFIGNQAGLVNNSGSGNSFIGNQAGVTNTTGRNNNFIGNQAGFNNSIGNSNNFLGNSAGIDNSTGSDNNFLGNAAGSRNSIGNANNFLGYAAGSKNSTGSDNNFY